MSRIAKGAFAGLFVLAAACQPKPDDAKGPESAAPAPYLAAATSDLPVSHILAGELSSPADGVSFSISNITAILAAPAYQSQPMFVGPDQDRFYYVAGNENGKTDLWTYDLASGAKKQITTTLEKSEFSPKPAPDGGVSFIQESEDGEMTRVHALHEPGGTGAAVIETGPVGYYEWLQGGSTLAVFYRSEPPMLQFVDVASDEARDVFENVGRVLQSSPDGATLFATRSDESGQYEIVAVDVAAGVSEPLLTLPPGAQDFFLTFSAEGLPAAAFSSTGTLLMTYDFANDSIWHAAADISDLGYDSISRIAVSGQSGGEGSRQIVFVVHKNDE
ncbi:hypothetical protein [Hyphococcus sp.]|uniref:hypothetical protein n=1 Tax=Hyphococcus sp. TaxID=2038636 RepID=UPI0020892659|nr:MAG: hypothetical protein DHS20C04_07900 [Marinicaulis sp.]